MSSYEVVYYAKGNGEEPVKDFIEEQPIKVQAKIASMLTVLQELGSLVREPYSKYLEDGIFEMRCKAASNSVRILCFYHRGRVVVLTNGFVKKQRKTPRSEIELAKSRRSDYLKRCNSDDVLQ